MEKILIAYMITVAVSDAMLFKAVRGDKESQLMREKWMYAFVYLLFSPFIVLMGGASELKEKLNPSSKPETKNNKEYIEESQPEQIELTLETVPADAVAPAPKKRASKRTTATTKAQKASTTAKTKATTKTTVAKTETAPKKATAKTTVKKAVSVKEEIKAPVKEEAVAPKVAAPVLEKKDAAIVSAVSSAMTKQTQATETVIGKWRVATNIQDASYSSYDYNREGYEFAKQAGEAGEKIIHDYLDGHLHVPHRELFGSKYVKSSQVDHTIVCDRGIILVETKNWAGDIDITNEKQWIQTKRDNTVRAMTNGADQAADHLKDMEIALKANGFRVASDGDFDDGIKIYSIVVFANKNSIITGLEQYQNVMRSDALIRYIYELPQCPAMEGRYDRINKWIRSLPKDKKEAEMLPA